ATNLLGDINADGKADIVRIYYNNGHAYAEVRPSTGDGYGTATANNDIGGWDDAWEYFLMDVNGDGKADLVTLYSNNGGRAAVRLSTGSGFPSTNSWNGSVGGWDPANIHDVPMDVNGDGRDDLVRFWNNGGRCFADVRVSTGLGFSIKANFDI